MVTIKVYPSATLLFEYELKAAPSRIGLKHVEKLLIHAHGMFRSEVIVSRVKDNSSPYMVLGESAVRYH